MSTIQSAEAFWDGHHHILDDANFWMAHPRCRRAINRRITGDAKVWPLDALARLSIARRPYRKVLSLGCGTGSLERTARKLQMCEEIEGLDSSEASLAVARERALEEGLSGIAYRKADLNDLRLPRRAYDLVVFHQSLHHVTAIEKLLVRVSLAVAKDGFLAIDEWTGPSRDEWNEKLLEVPRQLFAELPEAWRRWPVLRDPIEMEDPSEAVRSSAILPLVRRLFHVVVEKPYGGHIVPILLSQMALDRIPGGELDRAIKSWLALEEEDIERNPEASFHTALLARPRIGLDGFAARSAVLFGRGGARPARCDRDAHPDMGLFQRQEKDKGPLRLHIGCGQQAFKGWINIDNQPLPGVDRVLDVRKGLPYRDVTAIYAEHFLEHIGFDDALAFLKNCRRALADFGVLRISTPNLDWVYKTHYPSVDTGSPVERLRDCFQLNQAFHGWGHQFLYNKTMLESVLKATGFASVGFQRYGQSDIPDLNAIERHETYLDTPDLPHVLIAEASGKGPEEPLPADLLQNFHVIINAR